MRHCSQCKCSEYVVSKKLNGNVLECHKFQELGIPRYMKTGSVRAAVCEAFVPERKEDAPKKNYAAWRKACSDCGIETAGLSYEHAN